MPITNPQDIRSSDDSNKNKQDEPRNEQKPTTHVLHTVPPISHSEQSGSTAQDDNVRQLRAGGARGTAAMDPDTRQEVARKGGLAVSKNKQHMADIGRKGGQSVSKNREHMAKIGRKGGAASRGQRGSGEGQV